MVFFNGGTYRSRLVAPVGADGRLERDAISTNICPFDHVQGNADRVYVVGKGIFFSSFILIPYPFTWLS